jgi:hypothetical protein
VRAVAAALAAAAHPPPRGCFAVHYIGYGDAEDSCDTLCALPEEAAQATALSR